MARPMAINFVSWRKSLMKDCVKQCNVPLPSQGEYTRRDYIDAIRDDQRQFKYLATKNNHTLLEIAQRNNTNIRGTGTRGRILRKDLIGAIKEYTSPEAFREVDLQFYIANEQAIETKVRTELSELTNMKFETAMRIKFCKEKLEDGEIDSQLNLRLRVKTRWF